MLSQAVYWSSRTNDSEGWFYKSQVEWEAETGLTRYEQESAHKKLVKLGFMQEKKQGLPCKLYYRVDLERFNHPWMRKTSKLVWENQQTSLWRTTEPVRGKPTRYYREYNRDYFRLCSGGRGRHFRRLQLPPDDPWLETGPEGPEVLCLCSRRKRIPVHT